MSPPIGSIDGPSGVRRSRRRRRGAAADAASATGPAEQVRAAEAAAPVPPLDPAPHEGPPVISAQLMGQSGPAEGAAPAKSAARHKAYLSVEWSGPHDRRTRRGRIAKTDV